LATRKTIFKNYTIVELLMVLAIMGILLAASLKGFPMLFGKQGLVGSVRTLSSKVSMARSYAVTQNRYVALLVPDKTANTSGTDVAKYIYNYSRPCIVNYNTASSTYDFDSWIDGQEWTQLANGVCAYIEPASGYSINKVVNIQEIPFSSPNYNSSAIIFQNNGSLLTSNNAAIRVIPAVFTPSDANYTLTVDANIITQKRWNIMINPFTGKTKYLYGKEQ
jgi:type II secretory pathway pseudopilin PulG